jgi:uncharacterized protein YjiK
MRLALILSILSLVFGSPAFAGKKKKPPKAPRVAPLQILESYTLPAVEVSGMAWRTNPETKRRELVVVGDRDHKIYLVDWENRKKGLATREIHLKSAEPKIDADSSQSEWESVFSDETGRVFIVQENPAMILIVSADLTKVEGQIALRPSPKGAESQPAKGNSGGEGLVPLKNGHFLVLKEKNPLQVIEFAPAGEEAAGYLAELSIERKGTFPIPKVSPTEFFPAFTWQLSSEHEELFEDSSGLNPDPNGTLYLLGDQKNLIGRIGPKLKKDKALIKIDHLWSLPSSIRQPEGMVIDENDQPIVAVDRKNTKRPNLFLLSRLQE